MKFLSCLGRCVSADDDGDKLSPQGVGLPPPPPVMETCASEVLTNTTPLRVLSVDDQPWRVASPQDQPLLTQLAPGCLTPLTCLGEGAYGRVELCRVSVPILSAAVDDGTRQLDARPSLQRSTSDTLNHEGASGPNGLMDSQRPGSDSFDTQGHLHGADVCSTSTSPRDGMVVVHPSGFTVSRLNLQLSPGGPPPPSLSTTPVQAARAQKRSILQSLGFSNPPRQSTASTALSPGGSDTATLASAAGPHFHLRSTAPCGAGPWSLSPASDLRPPSAGSCQQPARTRQGLACAATASAPTSARSPRVTAPPRPRLSNELVVAVKRIEYRGSRGRGAGAAGEDDQENGGGGGGGGNRARPYRGPSRVKLSRMQAIELLQLARCRDCPFIVRVFGCVEEPPQTVQSPRQRGVLRSGGATMGASTASPTCKIVMEWAEGGDLGSLLKSLASRRPSCADATRERLLMSEASARFYMGCLLEALSFLHGRSLLHRDVKPANLLLTSDGRAKLGDLGMVCHLDKNGFAAGRAGTPNYMAPEVWAYGTSSKYTCYGANADLWSAGVVLYEMLTGHLPGRNPDEYLRPGWRITRRHAAFSPELCDLLCCLICVKPRRRLHSCADVVAHPWFAGFDWAGLRQGTLPAPYIPAEHRPHCVSSSSASAAAAGASVVSGASSPVAPRTTPPSPLQKSSSSSSLKALLSRGVASLRRSRSAGLRSSAPEPLRTVAPAESQGATTGLSTAAAGTSDGSAATKGCDDAKRWSRNNTSSGMRAWGGSATATAPAAPVAQAAPRLSSSARQAAASPNGTATPQGPVRPQSPCPRYVQPKGCGPSLPTVGDPAGGGSVEACPRPSITLALADEEASPRVRHIRDRDRNRNQPPSPAMLRASAPAPVSGLPPHARHWCSRSAAFTSPSRQSVVSDSAQSSVAGPPVGEIRNASHGGDPAAETGVVAPPSHGGRNGGSSGGGGEGAAAALSSLIGAVLASALAPASRLSYGGLEESSNTRSGRGARSRLATPRTPGGRPRGASGADYCRQAAGGDGKVRSGSSSSESGGEGSGSGGGRVAGMSRLFHFSLPFSTTSSPATAPAQAPPRGAAASGRRAARAVGPEARADVVSSSFATSFTAAGGTRGGRSDCPEVPLAAPSAAAMHSPPVASYGTCRDSATPRASSHAAASSPPAQLRGSTSIVLSSSLSGIWATPLWGILGLGIRSSSAAASAAPATTTAAATASTRDLSSEKATRNYVQSIIAPGASASGGGEGDELHTHRTRVLEGHRGQQRQQQPEFAKMEVATRGTASAAWPPSSLAAAVSCLGGCRAHQSVSPARYSAANASDDEAAEGRPSTTAPVESAVIGQVSSRGLRGDGPLASAQRLPMAAAKSPRSQPWDDSAAEGDTDSAVSAEGLEQDKAAAAPHRKTWSPGSLASSPLLPQPVKSSSRCLSVPGGTSSRAQGGSSGSSTSTPRGLPLLRPLSVPQKRLRTTPRPGATAVVPGAATRPRAALLGLWLQQRLSEAAAVTVAIPDCVLALAASAASTVAATMMGGGRHGPAESQQRVAGAGEQLLAIRGVASPTRSISHIGNVDAPGCDDDEPPAFSELKGVSPGRPPDRDAGAKDAALGGPGYDDKGLALPLLDPRAVSTDPGAVIVVVRRSRAEGAASTGPNSPAEETLRHVTERGLSSPHSDTSLRPRNSFGLTVAAVERPVAPSSRVAQLEVSSGGRSSSSGGDRVEEGAAQAVDGEWCAVKTAEWQSGTPTGSSAGRHPTGFAATEESSADVTARTRTSGMLSTPSQEATAAHAVDRIPPTAADTDRPVVVSDVVNDASTPKPWPRSFAAADSPLFPEVFCFNPLFHASGRRLAVTTPDGGPTPGGFSPSSTTAASPAVPLHATSTSQPLSPEAVVRTASRSLPGQGSTSRISYAAPSSLTCGSQLGSVSPAVRLEAGQGKPTSSHVTNIAGQNLYGTVAHASSGAGLATAGFRFPEVTASSSDALDGDFSLPAPAPPSVLLMAQDRPVSQVQQRLAMPSDEDRSVQNPGGLLNAGLAAARGEREAERGADGSGLVPAGSAPFELVRDLSPVFGTGMAIVLVATAVLVMLLNTLGPAAATSWRWEV